MELIIIIVIAIAICYSLPNKESNEPPTVPKYIPFIGHTWHLRFRAKEFLKHCREKYGDVFCVTYLSKKIFILSGEEIVRLLKADDSGMFEARNEIYFLVDSLGEWKTAPGRPETFIGAAQLVSKYFNPLVKRRLPEILKNIQEKVKSKAGDQLHIKLKSLCSEIITDTMANIFVCKELAEDEEFLKLVGGFYKEVENMMKFGLVWLMVPYIGSHIAHWVIRSFTPSINMRKNILKKITPVLLKRKSLYNSDNLAELMANDGHSFDTIAHGIMLLSFLSLLTSSGACQRLLADLLGHPEFFKQLRLEQSQFDHNLTPDQLIQMKRLDSSLRESMRHRGARPEHYRLAGKNLITNSGKVIPKGSFIAIDMAYVHFKTKQSHTFQPFQFVPKNVPTHKLSPDFMLFGTGRHACPGRIFAAHLVVSIVASIIRSYYIATEDGERPPFITHEDYFPNTEIVLMKLD